MLSVVAALLVAASPEVALLSSSGDTAELRFQPLGAKDLVAPVVRFTHAEGSDVSGFVLPGTRVVMASATLPSGADVSFANALLRLEAGQPARVLADSLAYGSKPLVTSEGRVFVSRGRAGPSAPSEPRVDELTVEEIDPRTGKARTVFATRGFVAYLAGALGRELLVYEVGPLGARLLAVHVDALGIRVLAPSLDVAHDFVVDAPRKRVLFTQRVSGAWSVTQVSTVDGATKTLATGADVAMLPTVRADGRVLISRGEGLGLISLDGGEGLPAQGPGFERVLFERKGVLLGLHETPSQFPRVFVLDGAKPLELRAPVDARLWPAGVLP